MAYLWLIVSWIVYFILHSILALRSVKDLFYSFGINAQAYRLIFNILAILLLIPIFLISIKIDSPHIFKPTGLSKFAGLVLATWGIIVIKLAFKSYSTKAFLGLRDLQEEQTFKTDGLLKSVRHPLYSGSILVILGYFVYDPKIATMVSATLMIVYFLVGIQLEEKKLVKMFGEAYLSYKNKTPMLIPRFKSKS